MAALQTDYSSKNKKCSPRYFLLIPSNIPSNTHLKLLQRQCSGPLHRFHNKASANIE